MGGAGSPPSTGGKLEGTLLKKENLPDIDRSKQGVYKAKHNDLKVAASRDKQETDKKK